MTEPTRWPGRDGPAPRADRTRAKRSTRLNWPAQAAALVLACVAAGPAVRAATAYDEIVAPIFRARCVACHGEEKQKGKLALHAWERVARGGDSGPLWVAGKPAESELVRRLRLPADDEEHMPPSDEPQPSREEIDLLVRWIEGGATQSSTLAELQLSPALAAAAAELPTKLGAVKTRGRTEPAWELDSGAVEKLRAPLAASVADLQRRFPGALSYESRSSAALHFTAAGLGRDFGDEEIARLAAVREALVSLDLSNTAVTDRSAGVLAGCTQLRVLRLGFTTVGDETGRALAALKKLEILAMPGTAIGEASVAAWQRLPALRRLHVDETPAAAAARAAKLPVVEAGIEALMAEMPAAAPETGSAK